MSKTKIINLELDVNRRLLFFSDIHGSPDLLRAALAKADFTDKDYLFFLGDVIEKGTRSLETLRLVMELCKNDNVFMILGNCDEMLNKLRLGNDNKAMEKYVLTVPNTIFKEMASIMNYDFTSSFDFEDFRANLLENFKAEFEFIASLPNVIILNDKIVLVHAGILDIENIPENSWNVMKQDYFLVNSPVQKKLMIVGHCPSVNYNNTYIWCNPIRSFGKNIITIDGGNNVINRGGQLNVLIIDKMNEVNISYVSVDNLKKIKVDHDVFYEPRNSYSVTFDDSKVEVIKEIEDFYLVKHLSTDNYIYAIKTEKHEVGEQFSVCDATNYFIPLQKGEKVSLVLKAKPFSIIKNNGIIGLVETKDLFN